MINLFRDVYVTIGESKNNRLKVLRRSGDELHEGGVKPFFEDILVQSNLAIVTDEAGLLTILNYHYRSLFPTISDTDMEELLYIARFAVTGDSSPTLYIPFVVSETNEPINDYRSWVRVEDLPFELLFIRYLNSPDVYREYIDPHIDILKPMTAMKLQDEFLSKLYKRNLRLGFGKVGRMFTNAEYALECGEGGGLACLNGYKPGETLHLRKGLTPMTVYSVFNNYLLKSLTHYMVNRPYDPELYFIDLKETYVRFYPTLFMKNNDEVLKFLVAANANILHSHDGYMNETLCEFLIKAYLDGGSLGKTLVS